MPLPYGYAFSSGLHPVPHSSGTSFGLYKPEAYPLWQRRSPAHAQYAAASHQSTQRIGRSSPNGSASEAVFLVQSPLVSCSGSEALAPYGRLRAGPTAFTFDLASDWNTYSCGEGITTAKAGHYDPAVAGGYWVMLKPLPAGSHAIAFTGSVPSVPFSLDVTYHLTVQ